MAEYDMLLIGAGQASLPLATMLAKEGWRVAVAERKHLGGSCVNFGCTPTKAVLASAKLAYQSRRAAEFGIDIARVKVDYTAVLERARRIGAESRESLHKTFAKGSPNDNPPELLEGQATFTGREGEGFKLEVNGKQVSAKQVVINTGTRSAIPDIEGLEAVNYINAGNWLKQKELPEHIVILGSGYIGLEMSQFYARMGSRVTVVSESAQVIEREDTDVASFLQATLQKEGVSFYLNTNVTKVQSQQGKLVLTLGRNSETQRLEASHFFIATGRKPNTDDLGLETIGIKLGDKGILETDERLSSHVAGIWVAGDVRGGGMFTHSSYDDYRILGSQLVGDKSRTTKREIPYAIFTDPNLARVGLSEKEAKEVSQNVKTVCYEMKRNGKAREMGEPDGFIKVVVDTATQKLLGAAVIAVEAAEMIHPYVLMMHYKLPYTALEAMLFIHPTLSEGIQSALTEVMKTPD